MKTLVALLVFCGVGYAQTAPQYDYATPFAQTTFVPNGNGGGTYTVNNTTSTAIPFVDYAQPFFPVCFNQALRNGVGAYAACPASSGGGGGATTPATNSLLKGNGSANGVVAATPGTDYLVPNGTTVANDIVTYSNTTGAQKDSGISAASNVISTTGTSLKLQQTGDTYGTTSLTMVNRTGANGAIVANGSLDLADFVLQGSSGRSMSWRWQGYNASLMNSGNGSYGELQGFLPGTNTAFFGLGTVAATFSTAVAMPAALPTGSSSANTNGTAAAPWGSTWSVAYGETLTTPASSTAACTAGQFTDDANYHYVCTATNTWKRVALSAF